MIKSNIGKLPVSLPNNIFIFHDSYENRYIFKGKSGTLQLKSVPSFLLKFNDISFKNSLSVSPTFFDSSCNSSNWGTYRSLVNQSVIGASQGFLKTLELVGLGFRGYLQFNNLFFRLGFSHEIREEIPVGVSIKFVTPTNLLLRSHNSKVLSQLVYKLYSLRKPDPYKGKGVRSPDRIWIQKEGKKKK